MNIEERLEARGYLLNEQQKQQFETYANLLVEWNQKINLTAITKREEIDEKHFFDSVVGFLDMKEPIQLCDVGAGAGFPSIPIKILFPQHKIVIVETLQKRVIFLKELCEKLGLKEVTIVNERAEEYAKEHREFFDVVTARAVANLRMLSELCVPMVKLDGLFVALKGSSAKEECEEAKKATSTLGVQLEEVREFQLQEGAIHMNLYYRKIKKTPVRYPRAFAQIKKQPL